MSASGKPKRELTLKQRLWVDAYLGEACGNATEAARIAGYAGSDEVLGQAGYQNLRHYELIQHIEARIADSDVEANEVIGTLSAQMRADMTGILTPEGHLDIKVIRSKGLGHLIKKIRTKRYREGKGEDAQTVEVTEVELHNSQAAAVQLCKVLGIERAPRPVDDESMVLESAVLALVRLVPGLSIEDARAQLQAVSEGPEGYLM
jgi:phage terminase small subunit